MHGTKDKLMTFMPPSPLFADYVPRDFQDPFALERFLTNDLKIPEGFNLIGHSEPCQSGPVAVLCVVSANPTVMVFRD